jgi:uncharacterized membrane protein
MIGRDARGNAADVWDLLSVGALVLLTNASVSVGALSDTPLRLLLGLPFVVFLPGYAVIAALFPRKNDRAIGSVFASERSNAIDLAERIGLSVALSVATVGLAGLGLSALGAGVGLQTVLWTVSAISLVALGVASIRRLRLSASERFTPSLPAFWVSNAALSGRVNLVLNAAVILAVVLAGVAIAFGTAGPGSEREYTELSVLSASPNGELTADSYPTNLTRGKPTSLTVVIDNAEGSSTTYTAVVELQRLAGDGQTVVARESVTQFETTLGRDQRIRRTVQVEPSLVGEKLRLVVLLYRGDEASASLDDAYREVHFNVTVSTANNVDSARFVRDRSPVTDLHPPVAVPSQRSAVRHRWSLRS